MLGSNLKISQHYFFRSDRSENQSEFSFPCWINLPYDKETTTKLVIPFGGAGLSDGRSVVGMFVGNRSNKKQQTKQH